MKKIFALVDCNNFYASCERVFRPDSLRKPVVILSNNDGCVVARSEEAKSLGIPFGAPYHKWKKYIQDHGGVVFSSNYTLYGDMSNRVMITLGEFSPDMEIYSIDEAFLSLERMPVDVTVYCREIRSFIKQCVGIPVSIGIGPSKTLAKAANKIAKKNPIMGGVFNFLDYPETDDFLREFQVEDLWGVGGQYSKMLRRNGIVNALQLRDAPDAWVKKRMTIMGLRLVMELRGISCLPLEDLPPPKKEIVSSRSFGRGVEGIDQLKEAMAAYVSRGAEKLRQQACMASCITIFLTTNRFKKHEKQYSNGMTLELPAATSYTPALIHYGRIILDRIYLKGYRYKKVGVMLSGIVPRGNAQLNLFNEFQETEKMHRVMDTMDRINKTMGRGAIHYAAEGIAKGWSMRRQFLSPRYTTHWGEIPVAKA